ncbi:CHASE2 domain-containing protein, partial [Oscillatoriales cyanobacterium LEGE 11467]
MTNKRSILILDGNLNDGCRVRLEMDTDGNRQLEMFGNLPPNPELAAFLETHWQQKYRQIEAPYRIQPEAIEYDGSLVRECQRSARELSDRFNDWLRSTPFQNIDRRLREELSRDDDVRILVCTGDRDLQKLPWHRWDFFRRYPNAEVALSLPEFDRPLPSPKGTATVRILAILGHDEGIEVEADRQLLASLPHAEVEFLVKPQLQKVNDRLWDKSWDILFFAGHSHTEGDRGRIYINPTDSLTIDELEFALHQAVARGLQLAIFNSCDGLGLAQQLSNLRIPQMVVMRELVPDRVAQAFLKYFLTAFAGGKPFYLAVRRARERLQGLEKKFPCASWLPVIFQHPDRVAPTWDDLWEAKEESSPATRKRLSWQRILALGTVATIAVLGVRSVGGLQRWEWGAYDFLMRQRPAEGIDPRILVVEATEEDVNRYGFPLPDGVLAEAIEDLQVHQPRVVALDIFRDRPVEPGHLQLQQLWESENLIALCGIGQADNPNNPGIAPPPGVPENRQGYSDIWVDGDGVLRRHVLFLHSDYTDACATPYSLAGLAALQYLE